MSNPFGLRGNRILFLNAIAIGLWIAGSLGVFRSFNGWVYDYFMELRSKHNPAPEKVFLLTLDSASDASNADYLARLTRALDASGARFIAFNFMPSMERAFYEKIGKHDGLLFGRNISPDAENGALFLPGPLPAELDGAGFIGGGICNPPNEYGIYRSQHSAFNTSEGFLPGFEVDIAGRLLGHADPMSSEPFLVDFRGGPKSLPGMSASRALSGGLVPELVRGKCVLVGTQSRAVEAGLSTPTAQGQETLTLLEYQGHALNTLLSRRHVGLVSRLAQFLPLMLVFNLSYLVYRMFSVSAGTWITMGLICSYSTSGALLFVFAGKFVPVPEWIVIQGFLLLALVRRRVVDLTAAFQHLLSQTTARLREKWWQVQMRAASPSWSLVAHMIDQTLDLKKLIFLEARPKKYQLKEIVALHCSFSDVLEKRRTYSRAPYTECIDAHGPIRVTDFFKDSTDLEEQYLSPLIIGGEILGFWAIEIDTLKAAMVPRFEGLLRDFSARISELLYHARKKDARTAMEALLGRKLLAEKTEEIYQNLNSALLLLQDRLDILGEMINRLDCGIIIYDVFGRMLQINDTMLNHLRKEDIAPFEMSALDLLLAISDYDISSGKQVLRKVIVEDAVISFNVELQNAGSSQYIMQVKPLTQAPHKGGNMGMDSKGQKTILFELLDMTDVTHLTDLKRQLTDRLFVQMYSDLAVVDLSSSMMNSLPVPVEHCRAMGNVIHERVSDTVTAIRECQQYLCIDAVSEDQDRFPVDPLPIVKAALNECSGAAEERRVTIKVIEPSHSTYTLASSEKLRFMIKTFLDVQIKDAIEDSVILVRLTFDESLVAFDFSNKGYGIPQDVLQEYIYGESDKISEEFANIQKAAKWVEGWGGMFEAVSEVGVGIHFTIQLARFM